MTTGQLGAFTAIAKKETTEEIVPAVFLMIIGIGLVVVDAGIYINAFYQRIQ